MKKPIAMTLIAAAYTCSIVFAQGDAPPAQPTTAAPNATPLQAGVQQVDLSLDHLRTVGLDLKNVAKATSSLYDEVTMQPIQMITQPEVIGFGATIINIPIGMQPTGPVQPARKQRVDLAMSQIRPTVAMFKENVDMFVKGEKELNLSDEIRKEIQPDVDSWVQNVTQLAMQEGQLEKLTASSPYDQPTIAQICVGMQKNIKELDKDRRDIFKVLKKRQKGKGNA
jgi:hypothetical protein